jgi:ABC-type transport system substrate-binding protein
MPVPNVRRAAPRLMVVLLVLLLVAPGCRGGDATPDRRTLVDSRDTYDPRSLDPALSTDVPTGRVTAYVFDGLTRFSPNATLEPSLAERWDVSPDGRVYTFHLRPVGTSVERAGSSERGS